MHNSGTAASRVSSDSAGWNNGKLAVVYRPTDPSVHSESYVPCEICYGYYTRRELWRHVRRCQLRVNNAQEASESLVSKKPMRPVRAGDQLLSCSSSDAATEVMSGMRKGSVYMAIRNDPIVHELARKLMSRAGHSTHHINYVRARLRKIGRVLLQIRNDNVNLRNATIRSIIAPTNFKAVIAAVKAVCGYSVQYHHYQAPSTAVHIGHDLRKCAVFLKSMAVQEMDHATVWRAQSFADLCSSDWNDEISGAARREMQAKKFNNPKLLPLTSDVVKLNTHLKDVQAQNYTIVQQRSFDSNFCQAFKSLTDVTLAQLIIFNRRRQGEVSKLTIDLYTANAKKVTRFAEVDDCLSPLEKELCQFFTRIELPGKRHNCVPLLITSDQKRMMDLLVDPEMRAAAGIAEDNAYVFALTKGSMSFVRGHDVLRSFAQSCGADRPMTLRSSDFRKHLATMSQVLNLKRHELDQVAQFMGHDIRVHRQFYRLPNDVIQTARVVRVLMAMENGTIGEFRGKSLEEIDVSDVLGKFLFIIGNCIYSRHGVLLTCRVRRSR